MAPASRRLLDDSIELEGAAMSAGASTTSRAPSTLIRSLAGLPRVARVQPACARFKPLSDPNHLRSLRDRHHIRSFG
jgi:hypothetical protein